MNGERTGGGGGRGEGFCDMGMAMVFFFELGGEGFLSHKEFWWRRFPRANRV